MPSVFTASRLLLAKSIIKKGAPSLTPKTRLKEGSPICAAKGQTFCTNTHSSTSTTGTRQRVNMIKPATRAAMIQYQNPAVQL